MIKKKEKKVVPLSVLCMLITAHSERKGTVFSIEAGKAFVLEHGAMLRAFSCESLSTLISLLRIIMRSIQEYTLQEFIGSNRGKDLKCVALTCQLEYVHEDACEYKKQNMHLVCVCIGCCESS